MELHRCVAPSVSKHLIMKTSFLLSILILLGFQHQLYADNPINSTTFSEVYQDVEIIQKAKRCNGIINDTIMDFLVSERKNFDVCFAIVSELGWQIRGKNNHDIFIRYLEEKFSVSYNMREEFLKKVPFQTIMVIAYMKVMDDYFSLEEAQEADELMSYVFERKRKVRKSYACNILSGIIESHVYFRLGDWCSVFKATNKIKSIKRLKSDIRKDAIDIIYGYLDNYQDSCE